MPTFDVQAFLRLIGEERINSLVSVPAIYWLALNQPNFRAVRRDGRQLGFLRRSADAPGPGAADHGGVSPRPRRQRIRTDGDLVGRDVSCRTSTSSKRPETVGFAAPVVDLKLDETHYEPGVGELLIRGPNIVKGYWNKPEATAETFTRGLAALGRPRAARRRRFCADRRSREGHGQPRRRERLLRRSRERAGRVSGRVRSGRAGSPRRDDGRKSRGGDRAETAHSSRRRRTARVRRNAPRRFQECRSTWSSAARRCREIRAERS